MHELGKVNSMQLYSLWKNLTIGMVAIIAMVTFSMLLPHFLTPVFSLLAAGVLYFYIFNLGSRTGLSVVPYALLIGLLVYSFVTVVIGVANVCGVESLPKEIVFFTNPFVPSLILNPVFFVVMLSFLIKRKNFHVCGLCRRCKIYSGEVISNSVMSNMLAHEVSFQIRNLTILFGIISLIIWAYFIGLYVDVNINARDLYIFIWFTVISFVLDELYFVARYYNLYLDYSESDEIVTPRELNDMESNTYLRYYVICGNSVYVDAHASDPNAPYKEIIDTPFFTKRSANGVGVDEVKRIIGNMTGYEDGELRFFYGRRSSDGGRQGILRYFYFLDGDVSDYQNMNVSGEWMDYEKIKHIYTHNPGRLAPISVIDTTRLATIIITEKIFDDNGYRKSKIRVYNPSFNLHDVRKSDLDFQDDKWIEISRFNSDIPLYGLKRWWRGVTGGSYSKGQWR